MIRIRLQSNDETGDLMSSEEYDEFAATENTSSPAAPHPVLPSQCDTSRIPLPTGRQMLADDRH